MTRFILLTFLIALTSCENDKPVSEKETHNVSSERLQKQQEELAVFMYDFDEAMKAKYANPEITPNLKNTDVFKIEGTKAFNYNFHITLHQQDQIEFVQK